MFEGMGKEQEPKNVGPPDRKTFSDLPWMWPKSQKRYDHVQAQTTGTNKMMKLISVFWSHSHKSHLYNNKCN